MFELLFSPENILFSSALGIMLAIAIMEGVGELIGLGIAGWLEGVIPDFDFDLDVDADVDVDVDIGVFTRFLGWIKFGQIPALILFIVFLFSFSMIGLVGQYYVKSVFGFYIPMWISVVPVFLLSLPCVRVVAGLLGKIIIKDETEAVSSETFVGKVAAITTSTATYDHSVEAKLKDKYGQSHYVRVKADREGDSFGPGSKVLLVRKDANIFAVIAANSNLTD